MPEILKNTAINAKKIQISNLIKFYLTQAIPLEKFNFTTKICLKKP